MAFEEFHADDVDSVNRMVGDIWRDQETVARLKEEYIPRLRMFHREGVSGAMGVTALVDCLRAVGLGPPDHRELRAELEKEIDWTQVDTQSSVEIRVGGQVHYGQFMGLGNDGMLYVKIEGDPVLQELPRADVKLADEPTDLDRRSFKNPLREDDQEKLAKRRDLEELLQDEPEPPRRRQKRKKPGRPKGSKNKKKPQKKAPAAPQNGRRESDAAQEEAEQPRFDWLSVEPGIDVLVQDIEGEWEPANFVDVGDRDGELIVIMHGENDRQTVDEGAVTLLNKV